jgi:cation/acetate symporter
VSPLESGGSASRRWTGAAALAALGAAPYLAIAFAGRLAGPEALSCAAGIAAGFLLYLLFLAGPLRRSGARTVTGFVARRLNGPAIPSVTSACVAAVTLLLAVPFVKGAAAVLAGALGAPYAVGVLVSVFAATALAVGPGARRRAVQALCYWLVVASVAIPAGVLLVASGTVHGAVGAVADLGVSIGGSGAEAAPAAGGPALALGSAASLLIALACGTAGLPHVAAASLAGANVRESTSSALLAVGLVSGSLALLALGGANAVPIPGGAALRAAVAAGTLAAFFAGISALAALSAGVLARTLGASSRGSHESAGASRRPAAWVVVAAVFVALGLVGERADAFVLVEWVFALCASTLFPVLVLAAWHVRLTRQGALAGVAGGGVAVLACAALVLSGQATTWSPALYLLVSRPAVWSVLLAFVLTLGVSRVTRATVPENAPDLMLTMHMPEGLAAPVGESGVEQA